jgi:hypothetical protein
MMRRTHHTILLVCEGYAEIELARVIRELYLPRGCGTTLTAKNARKGGGEGALKLAIEMRAHAEYDDYGVLVDTDRHWGDAARAQAQGNGIAVVENDPCLEAVLLQVGGRQTHRNTNDNKAAFELQYGGPAHRPGIIERSFARAQFDAARRHVAAIDRFLRLIRQ